MQTILYLLIYEGFKLFYIKLLLLKRSLLKVNFFLGWGVMFKEGFSIFCYLWKMYYYAIAVMGEISENEHLYRKQNKSRKWNRANNY